MSTLVATEMFSHSNITVEHSTPKSPELKDSKTSNGIRVITLDNGAPFVGLTFNVTGGSRAENMNESGYSHLLSSLAFNGSANSSPLRMIRDLENTGATFDSKATREGVHYNVNVTDDHVHTVVGAVADHISNPVNHDKYYTVSENLSAAKVHLAAHTADGNAQLDDLLHEAAYGENSPLGKPIHNTSALNADVCDLMAFRSRQYTAGNIVVTASGISHDHLKAAVEGAFAGHGGAASTPVSSPYQGGDIKVRTDLNGKTYAGVAFPVPAGAAASAYAVLANHLSNIHGITAFHHQYSDSGIFGFRCSGSPSETAEYIQVGLNALKSSGSANSKGTALNSIDSGDADGHLMNSIVTGVPLNAVASSNDVATAAKSALNSKPAYAVYGATSGTASYADVQKWCK